jgi:hypothetical protein
LIDRDFNARGKSDQVIRIGQRVRFIKVVDTPTEPSLLVSPSPKASNMHISTGKRHGERAQFWDRSLGIVAPIDKTFLARREEDLFSFAGA